MPRTTDPSAACGSPVRCARACAVLFTMLAACAGGEGTAPERADVAAITLSPSTATLGVGASAPLEAIAVSSQGDTIRAAGIAWSSSDVSVARVSASGVVTAVAVGSVQIAATVQGRSATARVSVVPTPVASIELTPLTLALTEGRVGAVTVRTLDAQGRVLSGRAVQWRSSNDAVATVSSGGVVTAVAAGLATVVATSEGRSASMAVTVSPVAVASVAVSPATATLSVGASRQLVVDVRDAAGAVLSGRTIVWSTSTPAIVSVSSTGIAVGVAPGSGVITASTGGRAGSASITVEAPTPPPVVVGRVLITPTSGVVRFQGNSNRTLQLVARAYTQDTKGDWVLVPDATFTWRSSELRVATVSSTGLVSGVGEGRVTITATSGTSVGTADITVERR